MRSTPWILAIALLATLAVPALASSPSMALAADEVEPLATTQRQLPGPTPEEAVTQPEAQLTFVATGDVVCECICKNPPICPLPGGSLPCPGGAYVKFTLTGGGSCTAFNGNPCTAPFGPSTLSRCEQLRP